jgi:hypothetical protein
VTARRAYSHPPDRHFGHRYDLSAVPIGFALGFWRVARDHRQPVEPTAGRARGCAIPVTLSDL